MRMIFVALLICSQAAIADTIQANSADECQIMGDVALVSKALVANDVEDAVRLKVLQDIYAPTTARSKRVVATIERASRTAKGAPREWAASLVEHCVRRSGAMDAFLGVET